MGWIMTIGALVALAAAVGLVASGSWRDRARSDAPDPTVEFLRHEIERLAGRPDPAGAGSSSPMAAPGHAIDA